MKKTAILFDHDGTLVDSIDAVVYCTNKVFTENGYKEHSVEKILEGFPYPTADRFKYHTNSSADQAGEMAKQFYLTMHAEGIKHMKIYPGIQDTLDSLAEHGFSMGMVTNNQGLFVRKAAAHLHYAYDLEIILGEENVKAVKPSPEGLLQACSGLAARPKDCWYIGDTIADHEAAHAAGMHSGLVAWGVLSYEQIKTAGADAVFRTPAELKNYFIS